MVKFGKIWLTLVKFGGVQRASERGSKWECDTVHLFRSTKKLPHDSKAVSESLSELELSELELEPELSESNVYSAS